jgi:hypothetical protein
MLRVHSARWRLYAALANAPWLLLLAVMLAELADRLVALLSPAETAGEGALPNPPPKVVVQLLLSAEDAEAAVRAIDAACCLHWPHRGLQVRPACKGACGRCSIHVSPPVRRADAAALTAPRRCRCC